MQPPEHKNSPIAPIFGRQSGVSDLVIHSKFCGDQFRGFARRGSRMFQLCYHTNLYNKPSL